MTEPLSAEREHEIRALDFLDLIRDNDEHTAARAALSVVCTLLNEIDRLRAALALTIPTVRINDNRTAPEVPNCGVVNPRQAATCTDPRRHDGDHHDAFGHTWPQHTGDKPLFAEAAL